MIRTPTPDRQIMRVMLHPEMHRELKLVAADLNISMAELIRKAVAEMLSLSDRPELIHFNEKKQKG